MNYEVYGEDVERERGPEEERDRWRRSCRHAHVTGQVCLLITGLL